MKKHILLVGSVIFGLTFSTAQAQPGMRGGMGGPPSGPHFGGDLAKIFGENSAFSASLDFHLLSAGDDLAMPGKIDYLEGKTRFEIDMSEMKSKSIPVQAAASMKQMGMDKMVIVSVPDKKVSTLIYPGLEGYVEMPGKDSDAAKPESDYKMEVTEIGRESVDGHACVKNTVVTTDKDGKTHESTVWNATDLKKFPIKILSVDSGATNVMLFKNIKLAKPDAGQFEAPAGFKKYDNMMSLMMSKMGGMAMPPER